MRYKWFHDLFFEPSDRWEDYQKDIMRKVLYFLIGFAVVCALLVIFTQEEPQPVRDQRPWKEILTPEQRGHREPSSVSAPRRMQQSGSKENKLINKLDKEDFNSYSDYHDGLDGEHSDIDHNEVSDYFRD